MSANYEAKRTLGRKVREMRATRDWFQEQMGEASDLHWTYIGQVERGERNLTLKSIEDCSLDADHTRISPQKPRSWQGIAL